MTRVAIVGAGIVGAALAGRLSAMGAEVTLIDSRDPGAATSATSFGWLNANRKLPRGYHDLSVAAMRQWAQLAADLGHPPWYAPTGNLTWAVTDQQRSALTQRLDRLRDWEYPADEITALEANQMEPSLRIPVNAHIAYFPSEGFVHGKPAVAALVAQAQDAGATLMRPEGYVTFEARQTKVTSIRLPDGTAIRADIYVCCAGWRTGHLLEPLGLPVPLVHVDAPGSAAPCLVTRTSGSAPIIRIVHAPKINLRPLAGGGVHLEASDINASVDSHTKQHDLDAHGDRLLDRARRLIPTLIIRSAHHRLCVRPLPLDGHPVFGWLPTLTNTYLAVTHSGITLAPLLARLAAAEIIHGGDDSEPLAPYRPSRFATPRQS
jgi:glycine/D-amino acid oxidase-like deaminating enzyme